ncbi:MAG TPA: endonuclease [Chitinophagales bacterium]|nr:endonuclease [Chitinophagales bacterium]
MSSPFPPLRFRFPAVGVLLAFVQATTAQVTEPLHNPLTLSFSNVKTYKFNAAFHQSVDGADGYLVLRKESAAPTALPEDGEVYVQGDFIGDAQVAYVGDDTAFAQSGTLADHAYHYCVFAFNGSGPDINYRQATPCSNFVTLPPPMVNDYYANINPEDTSFVAQLKDRIRTPYASVSYNLYDETMVTQFVARDAPGAQKSVTCVYSGQQFSYTPPFAWTPNTPFSREHTWCQSWMPTTSSSSNEFADQHHLFPVNQNEANGVRSNHPLGMVESVTNAYLEGKLGYNAVGQLVYEPRDAHKGDAARALLYMALRYDGIGGHAWTFNWLNTVAIPGIGEAPQSVDVLLTWAALDPPDAYERTRNDFIQSIQQNRNPFIDRPDFLDYLDFSTLTQKTPAAVPAVSTRPFDVHVYPIPSDGRVTVKPNAFASGEISLRWFDVRGALVKSETFAAAASLETSAYELPAGLYLLLVRCNDGVAAVRWLKD